MGWGKGWTRYGTVGRAGQGRAGQGRAGQGRAGQGRAGQGRAGQGRAGQGRAGQELTISTESWTTCELGYIHNLHRKLRPRLPVDASPYHAEGPPTTTINQK